MTEDTGTTANTEPTGRAAHRPRHAKPKPVRRIKGLDLSALATGGLVAVGAVVVGLLVVVVHNLFFYGPVTSAEQGIRAVFTDALVFLALLLVGLPAAAFVSVWRSEAPALTQGAAAVVLDWVLACGIGGAVLTVLPGGSADIFWLFFTLSPAFLCCQVISAFVAWSLPPVIRRLGDVRRRDA